MKIVDRFLFQNSFSSWVWSGSSNMSECIVHIRQKGRFFCDWGSNPHGGIWCCCSVIHSVYNCDSKSMSLYKDIYCDFIYIDYCLASWGETAFETASDASRVFARFLPIPSKKEDSFCNAFEAKIYIQQTAMLGSAEKKILLPFCTPFMQYFLCSKSFVWNKIPLLFFPNMMPTSNSSGPQKRPHFQKPLVSLSSFDAQEKLVIDYRKKICLIRHHPRKKGIEPLPPKQNSFQRWVVSQKMVHSN